MRLCGNRTIDLTSNHQGLQLFYMTNRATTHKGFSLEYKIKGIVLIYVYHSFNIPLILILKLALNIGMITLY